MFYKQQRNNRSIAVITADRANELAEIFEGRSNAPLSMDVQECVVTNLRPKTLAEVAEALRFYADHFGT